MSKDVEGECNARIYILEDYGGDESAAGVRCSLPAGHEGLHKESSYDKYKAGNIIVQWENDSRERCQICGVGVQSISWGTTCWTCRRKIENEICKECDSPDCESMIEDETCPISMEIEKRNEEYYKREEIE